MKSNPAIIKDPDKLTDSAKTFLTSSIFANANSNFLFKKHGIFLNHLKIKKISQFLLVMYLYKIKKYIKTYL